MTTCSSIFTYSQIEGIYAIIDKKNRSTRGYLVNSKGRQSDKRLFPPSLSPTSTMVKICPKLQSQGACNDPSCIYRHDVRICEECGVVCSSAALFQSHIQSKRHKRQLLGLNDVQHCPLCNMNVMGLWSQHLLTRRHCKMAKRQGETAVVEPLEATTGYCAICRKQVMPNHMTRHLQSPKHLTAEKYVTYKATLEEAEKNKHGVTVSDVLDFGIVSAADAQKGVNVQFVIQMTVPGSRIKIVSALFPSTTTKSRL